MSEISSTRCLTPPEPYTSLGLPLVRLIKVSRGIETTPTFWFFTS